MQAQRNLLGKARMGGGAAGAGTWAGVVGAGGGAAAVTGAGRPRHEVILCRQRLPANVQPTQHVPPQLLRGCRLPSALPQLASTPVLSSDARRPLDTL